MVILPQGACRIFLIDNRALFRDGLREILAAIAEFDVVGQADDVWQATGVIGMRHPDVILFHSSGDSDTIGAARHLRRSCPAARLIVLSNDDCPEVIYGLLELGISAYLTDATRQELFNAIRRSLDRDNHIVLSISRDSLDKTTMERPAATPSLSPRELEVLKLAQNALSNTQIARELSLTEATVKRHLRNVFAKLSAVSRIDAVNKAVAAALLPPQNVQRTSIPSERRAAS